MSRRYSQLVIAFVPDGVNSLICGPSAKRVGICFYAQGWDNFYLHTGQGQAGNQPIGIFFLGTGSQRVELFLEKHGTIVQGPWYSNSSGGGNQYISYIEVMEE